MTAFILLHSATPVPPRPASLADPCPVTPGKPQYTLVSRTVDGRLGGRPGRTPTLGAWSQKDDWPSTRVACSSPTLSARALSPSPHASTACERHRDLAALRRVSHAVVAPARARLFRLHRLGCPSLLPVAKLHQRGAACMQDRVGGAQPQNAEGLARQRLRLRPSSPTHACVTASHVGCQRRAGGSGTGALAARHIGCQIASAAQPAPRSACLSVVLRG